MYRIVIFKFLLLLVASCSNNENNIDIEGRWIVVKHNYDIPSWRDNNIGRWVQFKNGIFDMEQSMYAPDTNVCRYSFISKNIINVKEENVGEYEIEFNLKGDTLIMKYKLGSMIWLLKEK